MQRQGEQKEMLLYPASNLTRMFPAMWAVWLLKVHMDFKRDQAKEDPASPVECKGPCRQLRPLWGSHKGWGGTEGRFGEVLPVFLLLGCLYSRQAGRCWRVTGWAFDRTPSSCSRGLKMGNVIENTIQSHIACPKATQLPK